MAGLHRMFGAWTVAVLVFLYLPIALVIVYSFNVSPRNLAWGGFTTEWYAKLWHDGPLMASLKNSLIVATWTAAIATALGTLAGWLLFRYAFPTGGAITTLVLVPMVVPEVVLGIGLRVMYSLVGWPLGMGAIVAAHVTFCVPFVMVAIQARLAGFDRSLEEAALDLGATPARAFRKVVVPFLLPAIAAGAMMAFMLSMDEYIVTVFVAGPGSQTFPLKVFGMAKVGLSPMLNAASSIFIVGTALVVIAAESLRRVRR